MSSLPWKYRNVLLLINDRLDEKDKGNTNSVLNEAGLRAILI